MNTFDKQKEKSNFVRGHAIEIVGLPTEHKRTSRNTQTSDTPTIKQKDMTQSY